MRLEVDVFVNNRKGEDVTELRDKKWLWNLALLCDMNNYLNDLNNNLKGQQTHVWYVWGCQSFWNEAETISETARNC
jgi:hypothetical protein